MAAEEPTCKDNSLMELMPSSSVPEWRGCVVYRNTTSLPVSSDFFADTSILIISSVFSNETGCFRSLIIQRK